MTIARRLGSRVDPALARVAFLVVWAQLSFAVLVRLALGRPPDLAVLVVFGALIGIVALHDEAGVRSDGAR